MKYFLVPNGLIKDGNEYVAKVSTTEVYDVNRIAEEMIKYNSTATLADVKAVLEVLNFVVTDKLAKGCLVRLPFAYLRPTISGRFTSPADAFDRSRHTVNVRVSPTVALSTAVSNIQVSRQDSTLPTPNLKLFTNTKTKSSSSWSAGHIGKLIGSDMKYDEANAAEGLFLVNAETGDELRVEFMGKVTANELMFTMPSLTAGEYTMEVRKLYCSGKTLRKGILEAAIVVE